MSLRPTQYDPNPLVFGEDGCHLHEHCITCPLPACIYDTGPIAYANERDGRISAYVDERRLFGLPLDEVIDCAVLYFQASRRTINRALGRTQKAVVR